jgi:hypothetical protein
MLNYPQGDAAAAAADADDMVPWSPLAVGNLKAYVQQSLDDGL